MKKTCKSYRCYNNCYSINISGTQHPTGVTVTAPKQTEITVEGIDQAQVGQVAAEIRAWRKPEPYKGKGIRYSDEHVVRKQAKKA